MSAAVPAADADDGARCAGQPGGGRQRQRRRDRSERDVARRPDDDEKERHGDRGGERGQHREHAGRDRDAFAAVKAQPDRIDVPDDRGGTRQRGDAVRRRSRRRRADRGGALRDVERHDRERPANPGRAQDVGRADVPAAHSADVDTRAPGEQERERHGPGQIADQDADAGIRSMVLANEGGTRVSGRSSSRIRRTMSSAICDAWNLIIEREPKSENVRTRATPRRWRPQPRRCPPVSAASRRWDRRCL